MLHGCQMRADAKIYTEIKYRGKKKASRKRFRPRRTVHIDCPHIKGIKRRHSDQTRCAHAGPLGVLSPVASARSAPMTQRAHGPGRGQRGRLHPRAVRSADVEMPPRSALSWLRAAALGGQPCAPREMQGPRRRVNTDVLEGLLCSPSEPFVFPEEHYLSPEALHGLLCLCR